MTSASSRSPTVRERRKLAPASPRLGRQAEAGVGRAQGWASRLPVRPSAGDDGEEAERDVTGDLKDPLDELGELMAENSRILEEKQRSLESGGTPPTAMNFELTKLVRRMTETAQAVREADPERSEELRSLMRREAENGSFAADDALDLLADEDPWWRQS